MGSGYLKSLTTSSTMCNVPSHEITACPVCKNGLPTTIGLPPRRRGLLSWRDAQRLGPSPSNRPTHLFDISVLTAVIT